MTLHPFLVGMLLWLAAGLTAPKIHRYCEVESRVSHEELWICGHPFRCLRDYKGGGSKLPPWCCGERSPPREAKGCSCFSLCKPHRPRPGCLDLEGLSPTLGMRNFVLSEIRELLILFWATFTSLA